jgi:biopolymer transport protein TolR
VAFSVNTNSRSPMSEINVTPLVDVMLVLLIIFMVTAPMLEQNISVDLPQARGEPLDREEYKEKIVVSVSGQGAIYVNAVAVPEDKLVEKIVEATVSTPSRAVYLRADKNVLYGKVVSVMVALKAAGIPNVGMITTPREDLAPVQ